MFVADARLAFLGGEKLVAFYTQNWRKIRNARDLLRAMDHFGRIRSKHVVKMMREIAERSTAAKHVAEQWLVAHAGCILAAVAALGTLLAWEGAAHASTTARLVYLRGMDTVSCPGEGKLRDAVAARLGYDPFTPLCRMAAVPMPPRPLSKVRRRRVGLGSSRTSN